MKLIEKIVGSGTNNLRIFFENLRLEENSYSFFIAYRLQLVDCAETKCQLQVLFIQRSHSRQVQPNAGLLLCLSAS